MLTVDMRNHGLSDWRNSHSYEELAADLAEVIESFGGRADVLGHSMGGKASMAVALLYPRMVEPRLHHTWIRNRRIPADRRLDC